MARERKAGAAHVGREQTVEALGRRWRVARWTRERWDEFLEEYAAKKIPDPRKVVDGWLATLPESQHGRAVDWALEESMRGLSYDSPRVLALLDTVGGSAYMLFVLLRPHHPGVTRDEAFDVLMAVGQAEVNKAMSKAAGQAPPGPKGGGASPACPTPPSATSTPAGESPTPKSTSSSPASAASAPPTPTG